MTRLITTKKTTLLDVTVEWINSDIFFGTMVFENVSWLLLFVTCLLAFFVVIIVAGYVYFTWNFGFFESQGIPVDRPRLFKGTLEFPWIMGLEQQDLRNYKKFGPIYGIYEGRLPSLHVAEPNLLHTILVEDAHVFPNRRLLNLPDSDELVNQFIRQMRGEEWRELRDTISSSFREDNLTKMAPLIEACVKQMIDHLKTGIDQNEYFEARKSFSSFTLDVIATCAFGVQIDSYGNEENKFVRNAKALFTTAPFHLFLMYYVPKLVRFFPPALNSEAFYYFTDILRENVKNRLTNRQTREDFLHFLITTQDMLEWNILEHESDSHGDQILFDAIVTQAILFLFAGHETTAMALSLASYCLACNPEIEDKLIDEIDEAVRKNQGALTYEAIENIDYLENVILETLRMFPPLIRTERTCERDGYRLKGHITLKKGMVIGVPIYAIHHDPLFYPNPHVFDPERFSFENRKRRAKYTFIPFGVGFRSCIGEKFALMEMKIALAHLLYNFRINKCSQTKIPLDFQCGGLQLQPKAITLKLENRKLF